MILAGDVGGTKTHLALYEPGAEPRLPMLDRKSSSRDFPSLEALVRHFLDDARVRPTRAVLGVAGPVVDNRCETTNLPWTMDGASVSRAIGGARVTLLNDLEATAWSLPVLGPQDLEVLHQGEPAGGNRALIAAGTGLGESVVRREDDRWLPMASEGGHADFGPRDPIEDRLLLWLRAKYERVSYERILSGPGLADLYRFLSSIGRSSEPPAVARRFAAAPDPAAVVTETALDRSCERAALTLEKFAEIYGAEAGNLALKGFAVGGVYVGGGIAPRILPFLTGGRFIGAFLSKGRLRPVLQRVPVAVILVPQSALWGAAAYALATA